MPNPSKEEAHLYNEHGEYLKKLYVLSCQWHKDGGTDDLLADRIMNSLKWYMSNIAPDRPYWRVTFRFGSYPNGNLNTSILSMLHRVVMNMLPIINNENLSQESKSLFYTVVDYSDHLIDPAVGAQNRGVNWRSRFNQLTFHFLIKYQLFGETAINQLKFHFYDGYEYDPNCQNSGGMGTLTDGGFWHHGYKTYCLSYGKGDYETSTDYLLFFEGTPMEFHILFLSFQSDQLI